MQTASSIEQCAAPGAPRIRVGCRIIGLVVRFAAIASALGAVLLGPSVAFGEEVPEITIHFVDTGIESPTDTLDRFGVDALDRLRDALDWLLVLPSQPSQPRKPPANPFADSQSVARILIWMPSDKELTHRSRDELQQGILNQIRDSVNANLKKGVTDFEVQLVERVSLPGYAGGPPHPDPFAEKSPNRQDLAVRFGIAAYGALTKEVSELAHRTDRLSVYGTVGSNGSVLFARAVEEWEGMARYIGQVTYVDGRALVRDVMRTARVLGDSKLRIIVNNWDLPAPSGTIANIIGGQAVQAVHHGVTLLFADTGRRNPVYNHDSPMIRPDAHFEMEQYFYGQDRPVPLGKKYAHDLIPFAPMQDSGIATGGPLLAPAPPSHPALASSTLGLPPGGTPAVSGANTINPATGYPTGADIQRFAANLDDVKAKLDLAKPFIGHDDKDFEHLDDIVDYGQKFADLSAAIKQDAKEKRDFLSDSSHTVEKLAELEMSAYTDPDRLRDLAKLGLISQLVARRIGYFSFGANDIAGGLGTMVGEGRLDDIDAVTKTLDGVTATAWGIYGYLISEGNWDAAQAFATASKMTAGQLRDMTLPAVEAMDSKFSGLDSKIISIWADSQKQRAARGQSPMSIQEFYRWDRDILGKVGVDELARANAKFGLPDPLGPNSSGGGGAAKPLGGIRLAAPLSGATLLGVTIDSSSGNIILLGDRDFLARGLNLRDFAMALWLECGPDEQDPEFSLDPDDPKNPRGPWLRALYLPQSLEGRSFGAALFNGDLLLKELSFQAMLSPQGKLVEWTPAVPGFSSYVKLAMDSPELGTYEQFARFWIVADQVTSKQAGDTLIFAARMAVKARRQVPDTSSRTGLRDVETAPNTIEAEWARQMTDYYEKLAGRSPALARVEELAKAVAIAKSLKAAGARVDLARIADLLNSDHTSTVSRINAFSVNWQREQQMPFHEGTREGVRIQRQELHLFGGVDLTVHPVAIPDKGTSQAIGESAKAAFHMAEPGTKVVHFTYNHAPLVAIELPLLLKAPSQQ